ncbi:hypothetical protein [Actinomadura flavalba]|uniref:hypothetical protein n=1 Tax=Actinomadura flavalba TaxID=1120938 RepID=UPI000363A06F|nr:hypothetical protein [Actinomadura flavalba]
MQTTLVPLRALRVVLGALTGGALIAGLVHESPARIAVAELTGSGTRWTAAWSTDVRPPGTAAAADWSARGFERETLRQIVPLNAGGDRVRVRLSNRYGAQPLRITALSVARSAGGPAVHRDSVRLLRFSGAPGVVVAPGTEAVSDPLPFTARARDRLALTVAYARATGPATYRPSASSVSYRAGGDHVTDAPGRIFTDFSAAWYHLARVETAGVAA